ncbi:MAG: hypothetical protein AAF502_05270 [Bacteroidota bacterium]
MTNRYLLLLFAFFLFCLPANAQFGTGGSKGAKAVKDTELIVVLGYGADYNTAIKEAITKYWTFTKYKFITGSEYKKYCDDPRYSLLLMFTLKDFAFVDEEYDDIGIVLGGKCRYSPYEMLAYANMHVMNGSYYRAECVRAVQFMQNFLEMAMNESFPSDNYKAIYSKYNKSHSQLGDKQLVLQEEDLLEEYSTLAEVKKLYTHKVRFGGQSEVDQATLEQDENFVYTKLIFDVHGYKYRCAIQAKDSKILYAIETQNREVILMGKRTLRELDDVNNKRNHNKFFLGF